MNLFDRIIYQKDKGDSSNYDKVFSDMRSMKHSPLDKFIFDKIEISWTYFRPVDFYNDIILDSDDWIFFYLRNDSLTFESVFLGYSFEHNKPLAEREAVISSIYVFGPLFPGLSNYEKRPVRITSKRPFPNCPIKKMNYHFRTMLEDYERRTKAIFELTDYNKDKKGWQKIVERNKSESNADKTSR